MKKLMSFCLLGFFIQSIFSQPATETDSAFISNNYTKRETYITMRDGIKLFTTIYAPKDVSKKYPFLLKRTPYTVAPYGEHEFVTSFQNMTLGRQGNIFVMQDVRGRWMSESEFVDVRPVVAHKTNKDIDESTDTYDTVDWLLKNIENNNGRVGVYGISYPGFYATNALVESHPSVKAVSPQAPVTDWFIGDDFHHGGAFMLMDAASFYNNFGRPHPKPILPKDFVQRTITYPDNYNYFLKMGALPNYKTKIMGDSIHFWNDLMSHPNYDDFWKARNIRTHLKNTKPAVLVVGGLFDAEDCYGAWRTYEALEKQNTPTLSNRIVMGPWFHGGWGGRSTGESLGNIQFGSKTSDYFQTEIEAKFFNFYLKDEGTMNLSEATIFETGTNKWKNYDSWPPSNAKLRDIYFQPNGKLAYSTPSVQTGATEWISDPAKPVPYTEDVGEDRTREYMTDDQRFAARRPDVLVFETDVLAEDLTVVGPIDATLFFSTTGTDADVVVKVIDVFPDDTPDWPGSKVPQGGYQMLIRGEILRGRFRNSWEKPEAFVPNVVTKVPMQLPDISHTFKKGHRLMVQVQSSWFPIADRNPQKFVNIYQARDTDFQKSTHRVFHNSKNASYITIRVMD